MSEQQKRKKTTTKQKQRIARTPVPPRPFPENLGPSADAWRAKKRTEWREVVSAFGKFQYGSAFVPDQTRLYAIWRDIERFTESMDQPDWTAW